jgi:hypothetical protein
MERFSSRALAPAQSLEIRREKEIIPATDRITGYLGRTRG